MGALRRYGLGRTLQMFLQHLWDDQAVFPKVKKSFGWPFGKERGMIQEDLVSPNIFNIVVDAVERSVMLEVYGPRDPHQGLGFVAC